MLVVLLRTEEHLEEIKHMPVEEFDMWRNEDREMEVGHMCILSKGVEDRGFRKGIVVGTENGIVKGREEGREEEKLNSIRSLMKKLNLTLEQAMDVLDVPKSEQEKYAQLLMQ